MTYVVEIRCTVVDPVERAIRLQQLHSLITKKTASEAILADDSEAANTPNQSNGLTRHAESITSPGIQQVEVQQ